MPGRLADDTDRRPRSVIGSADSDTSSASSPEPTNDAQIRSLNSVDALDGGERLTCAPMNESEFNVTPLPTAVAELAMRSAQDGRADHSIVVASSPRSAPCRHCLRWADVGERMLLFPFAAIPPGRPYSESGPIFVHADGCQRYAAVHEYPDEFRAGRVLRAYNAREEIIGAKVVNGNPAEELIREFLRNEDVAFLHARSVGYGCYTFRVDRA